MANVILDGVAVDCDCNSKWLRLLKPNVRCGFPGALVDMKVSQISPEVMTCQAEDKGGVDHTCTVLPVPVRPAVKAAQMAAASAGGGGAGVTPPADPELQIVRGSMTQAWPSRSEIEAKSQELDAIQAARQIRNTGLTAVQGGLLSVVSCLILSIFLARPQN